MYLIKGFVIKIYLLSNGCKVGKRLKCKKFPLFRTIPRGNIFIGNNVNIGYRITFDILIKGKLNIGNFVNLTQDIVISSSSIVNIANNVLIAENVSIRDSDHGTSSLQLIREQPQVSKPISIDEDVWIASGCRILKGVHLPEGCIIGTNSIVTNKSIVEPYSINVGSPCKKKSNR